MEKVFDISLPSDVGYIIEKLNREGFQAFAVGGCVRDSLLGKEPKDWDITTDARPEQVKGLFEKTIDTGLKHGTVTVVLHGENYEVTTFRIDGEYLDNRKPSSVLFTASLDEDLSRRDFTINAIAYHPQEGVISPFDGIRHLQQKLIVAVGKAEDRFQEDALRMLRAVRFSAQLDFTVTEEVLQAIALKSPLIQNISHERIRDELTKTLISQNPMKFVLLRETGILRYVLPEFDRCFDTKQNNPYHVYNVALHTLTAVANIEAEPVLRWTMLLHDVGKAVSKTTDLKGIDHFYGHQKQSVDIAKEILKRLRFDNKSSDRILRLIEHHDRAITASSKSVRKAAAAAGADIFEDLLKVQEADKRAQNPEYLEKRLIELENIRNIYREITDSKQCVDIRSLAVNGNDLMELGYARGKLLGQALNHLFKLVLEDPALNTKEQLLDIAQKIKMDR